MTSTSGPAGHLGTAAPDRGPASSDPQYGSASWRALGTYAQLSVADVNVLDAARAEAHRLLDEVDRACSRFRDDSDLMRANRGAGEWVRVDPLLPAAIQVALHAAEVTDGLVDPTLGLSLAAVGYDADLAVVQAREGHLADPSAIPAPPVPAVRDAWRQIELAADAVKVPRGVSLDLGATGKAFAADLLVTSISALTQVDVIVSLGGDVAIAPGDPTKPATSWPIEVGEDPDAPPAQTVELDRGGLATSSTVRRRWKQGDRLVHHLLDPRTGQPVTPVWRTVTVAAESCATANTASTAAIILGELATDWLADYDLAARLVSSQGHVVCLGGWPEEDN